MIRRIAFGALAAVFALTLANTASAAFFQVAVSSGAAANEFVVEAQIVMEEDVSISTVDVGVTAMGGVFTSIDNSTSFFDGRFLGAANALQGSGAVANFSGSELQGAAVTNGEVISLGTAVFLSDTGAGPDVLLADVLYEVNATTGGIRSDTGLGAGDVVPLAASVPIAPEPATIALLGLGLAGFALRRRS